LKINKQYSSLVVTCLRDLLAICMQTLSEQIPGNCI